MAIVFSETGRFDSRILQAIEAEIQHLFASLELEIADGPQALVFGKNPSAKANYYEVSDDSLARLICAQDGISGPLELDANTGAAVDDEDLNLNKGTLGMSCLVKVEGNTFPAIFLNSQKGTAKDKKLGEALHTLIHESIHMNSFKGHGFQKNGGYFGGSEEFETAIESASNADQIYFVLDEGSTELFARIVKYNIYFANNKKVNIEPCLPFHNGIPVYELPLRLVCDMARDFGLQTLAEAYFSGNTSFRSKLTNRITKVAKNKKSVKYGKRYLELVSTLKMISEYWGGARYTLEDIAKQAEAGSQEKSPDKAKVQLRKTQLRELKRQKSMLHVNLRIQKFQVQKLNELDALGKPRISVEELKRIKPNDYVDPAVALCRELGLDKPKIPNPKLATMQSLALFSILGTVAAAYLVLNKDKS